MSGQAITYVVVTPPSTSGSTVLLHFESGMSPSVIVDSNTMAHFAHNWTLSGTAVLDTSDFKFGQRSLKCDGAATSAVVAPDTEDFTLSNNDWTIDFWFKVAVDVAGANICGQANSAGSNDTRTFNIDITGNVLVGRVHQGTVQTAVTGTTNLTIASHPGWHHCAFVRYGDVLKLFVDGVQEGGDVAFTGAINNSSNQIAWGKDGEQSVTPFNGWIDEVRMSVGFARWVANFTPPSAPDTGKPTATPVQVLLNFDETNSPGYAIDENNAGGDHFWTMAGNAFIDSSDKKFGFGSLKLDGTGDAATTTDTEDFTLGANDFTIDCWFKVNVAGGTQKVLAGQLNSTGSSNTNSAWFIDRHTTNVIRATVTAGTTDTTVTGTTQFTNAVNTGWHHVAFVRIGNTLKLFIDGVQEGGNVTFSSTVNNSTAKLGIGSGGDFVTNMWNGWVDAFRMSIGTARWTANFTPDSAADPLTVPSEELSTYRFAVDNAYVVAERNFSAPNIKELKITPATISLGENLGQRASVTVVLKDTTRFFAMPSDPPDRGSFFGKWRARYRQTTIGYDLFVQYGYVGDALENFETRRFIIESTDGPTVDGEFKIIAKDVLKFADGDKAQAPMLSSGYVAVAITNASGSVSLIPTGIGNSEYPVSGYVNIGGKEICAFTRSADTLTITRAQFNTTAVAHDVQERVQVCLQYTTQDVAAIIADLFLNYTDVESAWVPLSSWQAETASFLNTVYSALIAEPTSVNQLISELVEQAGLAIWWNDITQQINLQVLRPVATDAAVYSPNNYLAETLEIKEQPEKRLSQVYTYFAQLNPLINLDQINNFKSTAFARDATAEAAYGGIPAIKKIYSRWIPDGGRAMADTVNAVLLARFRDPPRRISFNVLRDADVNPQLGTGYLIEGWPFQAMDGKSVQVGAQITRLNPRVDYFEVEAEEIATTGASAFAPTSPDVHTLIIDTNQTNLNLRTMHDSVYGTPASGFTINVTIQTSIRISTNGSGVAFDVGSWPASTTINITNNGRIQGWGGNGGISRAAGNNAGTGTPGSAGGTAFFTRQAVTIDNTNGQIFGGGGGGGGITSAGFSLNGCGGGGAGITAGVHGGGDNFTIHGSNGTSEAGGAGGVTGLGSGNDGGNGGGPGLAGNNAGFVGGAAGAAVDGISFCTFTAVGDRRGGTIN